MVMTGAVGKLRVGYQDAAMLRNWNLTLDSEALGPPRALVVGVILDIDRFWISQSPLDLGLLLGASWWVWEKVTLKDRNNLVAGIRVNLEITGDPVVLTKF